MDSRTFHDFFISLGFSHIPRAVSNPALSEFYKKNLVRPSVEDDVLDAIKGQTRYQLVIRHSKTKDSVIMLFDNDIKRQILFHMFNSNNLDSETREYNKIKIAQLVRKYSKPINNLCSNCQSVLVGSNDYEECSNPTCQA